MLFALDEGRERGFRPLVDIGPRWKELPHAASRSRGFVLIPGEEVGTGEFLVDASHRVYLSAMRASERISGDGLGLELVLRVDGNDRFLGELHLGNEQHAPVAVELELGLRAHAGVSGELLVRCTPGADSDPAGDWAALLALVVATDEWLPLGKARSQAAWRLRNEGGRFDGVYRHGIYGEGTGEAAGADLAIEILGGQRPAPQASSDLAAASRAVVERMVPEAGETAFGFANRLLAALAPPRIDFAERLRKLPCPPDGPRILSLCAGEARVEAELLRRAAIPATLTLLDLDPLLLRRAAARFPPGTRVRAIQGPVEAFAAAPGSFDAVMFVSGLHHVPELESVVAMAASVLAPDGEFWLVGEQVGPNGNRLWPEAQRIAERLFRALPERLRVNRSEGHVDPTLPDKDFSSSCHEGIRSQDIPGVIARYFTPLVEDRRNCFLWRFVEIAYEANYDLCDPGDVALLRDLVAEEFAFYAGGGLGCELNGAYRGKLAP